MRDSGRSLERHAQHLRRAGEVACRGTARAREGIREQVGRANTHTQVRRSNTHSARDMRCTHGASRVPPRRARSGMLTRSVWIRAPRVGCRWCDTRATWVRVLVAGHLGVAVQACEHFRRACESSSRRPPACALEQQVNSPWLIHRDAWPCLHSRRPRRTPRAEAGPVDWALHRKTLRPRVTTAEWRSG